MRMISEIGRLSMAVGLAGVGQIALAADGTWIGQTGFPRAWLASTNWSGGILPGETNNAGSLNTDVATMTNASATVPILQIDFSPSGANGHLALGAIVSERSSPFPVIVSATVRPAVNGGMLTLNGATVHGMQSTILVNSGTGFDNLSIGEAGVSFAAVRLGSTTNVIRLGSGKGIVVRDGIAERIAGSGITVTSETGEVLLNPGRFSGSSSNTFTGPVRIEKGTLWAIANQQSLGLSSSSATNVILDNGALRGSAISIGRLFTLGVGGGRLEATLDSSAPTTPFAFTNTGAIAFEGVGPRILTFGSDGVGGSQFGAFAAAIGDAPGGGKTSVVNTNGAIWTLTASNTYSGDTTIGSGTLELSGSGSFANSPTVTLVGGFLRVSGLTNGANYDGARFALAGGQTLTGSGSVSGPMSVGGGATLSPGLGFGILSTRHLFFAASNAVLAMEVNLGAPVADLLQVFNGGIDAGGATLNLSLLNAPTVPSAAQTFMLIANDGSDPITNQFGTVNLNGANSGGYACAVDYAFNGTDALGRVGDGNDLAITLAPATNPSQFSLSITVSNSVATLTWPSMSNQTYWVQYKSALTNANWDELSGEVIATGDRAFKTDPVGPTARFYRVRTD